MIWQAEALCPGAAMGEVMRLDAPISFWGGINPDTAKVTLAGHPQCGECISDKVLVIPRMIGSSSSSAILLELIYKGLHPRAILLGAPDAILPVGIVVSRQMGWPTLPMFLLRDPPFATGDRVVLDASGAVRMQA